MFAEFQNLMDAMCESHTERAAVANMAALCAGCEFRKVALEMHAAFRRMDANMLDEQDDDEEGTQPNIYAVQ